MRNSKLLLIGIGLLFIGTFMFTVKAQAVITGSAHDFSGSGWSGGQICVACHTPHNAMTPQLIPLWNHTETASSFTVYGGIAPGASGETSKGTTVNQPAGVSKACLSCHDGSIALDSYGQTPASTAFISTENNVGTDLSDDHPISLVYRGDEVGLVVDNGDGTVGTLVKLPLYTGNTVECASCHDVHNTADIAKLLRQTMEGSALCQTCHAK